MNTPTEIQLEIDHIESKISTLNDELKPNHYGYLYKHFVRRTIASLENRLKKLKKQL